MNEIPKKVEIARKNWYETDCKGLSVAVIRNAYERGFNRAYRLMKAQERPHGRWEYKERHRKSFRTVTGYDSMGEVHTITICEESQGKEPYCGICGAQAAESFMDYCPHCGAIMDNQPQAQETEVE